MKKPEPKPLRLKPVNIDETAWYYEKAKGIDVIHEIRLEDGAYLRTDHIAIPWKRLLESVRRKYGSI